MRNSKGFTLAELVVSVALMGVLFSFALPAYQSSVMETQHQINLTNMIIIKQTFMRYWLEGHMKGNPQYPPMSENDKLDEAYSEVLLDDGRTVSDLFSGDMPMNSNNNPFSYYTETDTSEFNLVTYRIIISDEDEDSPSYLEEIVGEN